jgi:hypothetical protein
MVHWGGRALLLWGSHGSKRSARPDDQVATDCHLCPDRALTGYNGLLRGCGK